MYVFVIYCWDKKAVRVPLMADFLARNILVNTIIVETQSRVSDKDNIVCDHSPQCHKAMVNELMRPFPYMYYDGRVVFSL